MTNNETLPAGVPAPDWERDLPNVTIDTDYGQLVCRAMGDDDVYVEGELTYRGNTYRVPYVHTNNAGMLKGYASNGRDYGVVTADWQIRQTFSPNAPKTFAPILAATIMDAVSRYLTEYADHAAENRRIQAVQDMNRKASDYNRKAVELAELLTKYEDAARRAGLAVTR